MWEYNNELYHHGVKGQRWGVRRYQNEDGSLTEEGKRRYGTVGAEKRITYDQYHKDWRQSFDAKEKVHKNTKQIIKLNKENDDLLNKYDFDADDGGGGSTSADRKAGAKYWKNVEKINELDKQRTAEVKNYVNNLMLEKYGSERIRKFHTVENTRGIIEVTKVLAVMATFPVSVPLLVMYGIATNGKKK